MSKVEKTGKPDYHKFDAFSTEELQTVLQAYFAAPDGEQTDIDAVLYITNLLAERADINEEVSQDDVAAAKAKFYKHYYTLTDESESLYDFVDEQETDKPAGLKRIWPLLQIGWRRFACVVAVLVLLVFGGTVTAYAFGYDPLAAIVNWNTEQSSGETLAATAELMNIMAGYTDIELVPKWLPDGYLFDEFERFSMSNRSHLKADFYRENSRDTLGITYAMCKPNYSMISFEVEAIKNLYDNNYGNVAVYSINKIDFYILGNDLNRTIAWLNENFECTISGAFSIEEAVKIINSIYE